MSYVALIRAFLVLSFIAGGFVSSVVLAASFDCAKAVTHTEKVICGNAELGKLDEALSSNFRAMLGANTGASRAQLLAEQRNWLALRDKCESVDCLVKRYSERVDETCTYAVVSGVHPPCVEASEVLQRVAPIARAAHSVRLESPGAKRACLAGICLGHGVNDLRNLSLEDLDAGITANQRQVAPRNFVECERRDARGVVNGSKVCDRLQASVIDGFLVTSFLRSSQICSGELRGSYRQISERVNFTMAPFTSPEGAVEYRVSAFTVTSERESRMMRTFVTETLKQNPTLCRFGNGAVAEGYCALGSRDGQPEFSYSHSGRSYLLPPSRDEESMIKSVEVAFRARIGDKPAERLEHLNLPQGYKAGCLRK